MFSLVSSNYYEWGNKQGRLLACALKQKQWTSFISKLEVIVVVLMHM